MKRLGAAVALLLLAACTRRAGDVIRQTPLPPPATAIATVTAAPPTPTSAAVVKALLPTVDPSRRLNATMFLVALDDNGKRGRKIGCNDSLVALPVIVDSEKPIAGALAELFAARPTGPGMYTALAQSNLRVEATDNANGQIVVRLRGDLRMGGACDTPRVAEQIRETVTQFSWSKNAQITLNGAPLEQALR